MSRKNAETEETMNMESVSGRCFRFRGFNDEGHVICTALEDQSVWDSKPCNIDATTDCVEGNCAFYKTLRKQKDEEAYAIDRLCETGWKGVYIEPSTNKSYIIEHGDIKPVSKKDADIFRKKLEVQAEMKRLKDAERAEKEKTKSKKDAENTKSEKNVG